MNVYQPTALEQVHAFYLAQNVFGIQPNSPMHISGRNAVPFLTQSGLDRMLLRNIWSAADPDNVGSLTSHHQFHLMLRLVAMAQAGMLNMQQDSNSMRISIQQQSSVQLMLPTFSSVILPPQEQLFNMYGSYVVSSSSAAPQPPPAMGFGMPQNSFGGSVGGGIQNVHSFGSTQASTGGTVTGSISDAFGDLGPVENAPIPSLGEIPQTQAPTGGGVISDSSLVGTNSFPSTDGSAVTGGTSSISDVFGSGVSDAPLPPLGGIQAMGGQQQQSQVNDDDDAFGDFGTAPAAPPSNDLLATSQQPTGGGGIGDSSLVGTNTFPSTDGSAVTGGGTTSISDVFGTGLLDAPLPPLGGSQQGMAEQQQHQNVVNDDDFGDFGTASSSVPPAGPNMTASSQDFTSSIPDAFGSDMADMNQQQQTIVQEDDFGGFENAAPTTTTTATNEPNDFSTFHAATAAVDDDDPFGAMQAVPDAPIMSLDQFGSPDIAGSNNQVSEAAVVSDANANGKNEEDDEFGGFEVAGSATFPSTTTNQPISNDFNKTAAPAALPANDDDPFGVITQPDAPMMSLDQFGSTNIGSHLVANAVSDTENENKEDDEFGGFEDAGSAPAGVQDASQVQAQAGSDFHGFQDASSSVSNNDKGFVRQMSSDSHYSGASSHISESQSQLVGDVSQQPNLTETPSNKLQRKVFVETVTSPQLATPSTAGDPFSAFDAVTPSPAVPMPPLVETVTSGTGDTPISIVGGNNEFTNFESTPAPVLESATAAFDAVTPSPAVPLPPLVETVMSGTGDTPISIAGGNIDFGNFESTPAPVLESATAAPASTSTPPTGGNGDLFGAAEPQGAAEPDMQKATTTAPTDATGDDDDWGGFDAAVPAATTSATGGSDLFGSQQTEQIQNATVEAPPKATDDGEEDWGGFDSVPAATATTSTTTGDNVDLFGSPKTEPVQNASTPEATDDDWGDFGTAPTSVPQTSEGTDFFGAPEATETQNVTTVTPTPEGTDDDWGDFGNAPASAAHTDGNTDLFGVPGPSTETQNATIAAAPPQGTVDDDWGDFGTAPASATQMGGDADLFAAPATTDSAPSAQTDTDLFGAPETTETQNATIVAPPVADDDWGAFDAAAPSSTAGTGENVDLFGAQGSTTEQNTTITAPPEGTDDDWGAFDNAPSAPAPKAAEVEDDADFGAFDEAPASSAEPVSTGDDDWGDFDKAPSAPAPKAAEAEDDADFGAFDEAPASSASAGTDDDDWGDFGNAPSAPAPMAAAGGDNGDFGNFETAAFEEKPTEVDHKEKIRALSTKLPEALLRKKDSSDHVDLVESYDVNLGMDFPLDSQRGKRFDRCIQILELLSEEDSKLGSAYWQQALVVVRDEIQLGKSILLEAKELPSKDFGKVKKPLSVMMAGMIEYMRITRSIVATFGDILMLDPSALLTIDTWKSTWCTLSILETAIEIETIWKELLTVANGLLKLDKARIDEIDLATIRKNLIGRTSPGKLCHLTLQPLGKKSSNTTRSKVTWNGLHYMACSANFLAHKCPFYVISR